MLSTFEFSENIVGIMVDSNIDGDSIKEIHNLILERLELHPKINLFFEIPEGDTVSFAAILKDLIFKFEHASRFNKIAMVTDLKRMEFYMEIKDSFMNANVKTFSNDERLEAMNWIMN